MNDSPVRVVFLRDRPARGIEEGRPQKIGHGLRRPTWAAKHATQLNFFFEAGTAFFRGLARLKEVCDGNPWVREDALVSTQAFSQHSQYGLFRGILYQKLGVP